MVLGVHDEPAVADAYAGLLGEIREVEPELAERIQDLTLEDYAAAFNTLQDNGRREAAAVRGALTAPVPPVRIDTP